MRRSEAESVTMVFGDASMERMLATPADAEIVLKLYQLRTEAVMRQARAWVTGDFWPVTAEEYLAVAENSADPHNAWLRQVLSYWEMAAAMVLHATPRDFSCWPSLPPFLKRSGKRTRAS